MKNLNKMKIAGDMQFEIGQNKVSHFPTWEVKDDKTLCKKVEELKHSTFDLPKFTVVGSPTITDDGVASGFTTSNYIKIPNINFGNKFVITGKFHYISSSSAQVILTTTTVQGINLFIDNSGRFANLVGNGNDWINNAIYSSFALNSDTDYYIKYEYDGTSYNLYYSIDGKNYIFVSKVDSATQVVPTGTLHFGLARGGNADAFQGSIDLSHFSITVDGKEVFSGNKTGIDVIKHDNYEVVGRPVISEDGIATFVNNSAISHAFNSAYTASSGKYFIFEQKIDYKAGSNPQTLFDLDNNTTPVARVMLFNTDNKIYYWNNLSSSSFYTFNYVFSSGNTYNIKLKTDFITSISLYINDVLNQTISLSGLDTITFDKIHIGNRSDLVRPLTSECDLNLFKFYDNTGLVYQPCLKIPYTQAKLNHKIVDAVYRDRVQDLFEQVGYNGYFTLGENDFTLPSNKWSDVIEHKENGLTVAEQRVDQTLTIRGACEQGVDVNLPMEFFSDDSYAVFGVGTTGTNTASKFTPAADGNYIAIGKGKV